MKKSTFLIVVLVMLVGCGGGGSGDDPNQPEQSVSTNQDFRGKIFIGNDEAGPWLLDISTGHYSKIPGVNWTDNPDYHSRAEFSAFPAHDGQEFVETIERCEGLGGFDYQDCLIIHDAAGNVVSKFNVPYETFGPAKLSRDGMFVAVLIREPFSALNPKRLSIYTRDGAFVDSTSNDHDITVKGFDWLPDNRLLYAVDRAMYVTNQTSGQSQQWATFTEDEGEPDHLAVSPNGQQLAFTLKTSVTYESIHGAVWVVNLDASRFVQLATTPEVADPVINFPMWSPDGEWIALIEGAVGVMFSPSENGQGSRIYIVPSDGENVELTLDGDSEAIPVYSYYDEALTPGSNAKLGVKFTTLVSGGGFSWVP
ncbi:MAG: hypothetical protein JAY84_19420 [Candidatus Thiodiazotropha taylori]|nr:hypothetical protein [Candidatus Thiodiazotropha taylori]